MTDSPSNKHKLVYFLVASVLVCFALGTGIYALGLFAPDDESGELGDEPEQRYRHISMSEAQTACERRAREAFGQRLFVLTMDKLSSRLDQKEDLYKLFFKAELFATAERQGPPQLYYINCFTGIHSPRIRDFVYSADGRDFEKPGEEPKGLFGM